LTIDPHLALVAAALAQPPGDGAHLAQPARLTIIRHAAPRPGTRRRQRHVVVLSRERRWARGEGPALGTSRFSGGGRLRAGRRRWPASRLHGRHGAGPELVSGVVINRGMPGGGRASHQASQPANQPKHGGPIVDSQFWPDSQSRLTCARTRRAASSCSTKYLRGHRQAVGAIGASWGSQALTVVVSGEHGASMVPPNRLTLARMPGRPSARCGATAGLNQSLQVWWQRGMPCHPGRALAEFSLQLSQQLRVLLLQLRVRTAHRGQLRSQVLRLRPARTDSQSWRHTRVIAAWC
jgi:hypothetical protein